MLENDNGNAADVAETVRAIRAAPPESVRRSRHLADDERATERLTSLIEPEIRRLRQLREELQAIADADAARCLPGWRSRPGTEGDRHRGARPGPVGAESTVQPVPHPLARCPRGLRSIRQIVISRSSACRVDRH